MIKTIATTLIASASLTFAGDFYAAPAATNSSYTPAANDSGFFAGLGFDYLDESETELYTAHLGKDFGPLAAFLEVGYANEDDFGVDLTFVPVTVNFKYEAPITEALAFYIGAGAGVGFLDVDVDGFGSDDDTAFVYQAFAGLVYNLSESFEIYGGARYFGSDDTELLEVDLGGFDEVTYGAGIRFNF